ncbi:hypothetical protein PR202_gb03510 [Eleusine coracana subsp. coracana]|uniref:Protein kinase domain-containing protein n=1 Tax=Eleusine coracana subsp. coracana TaxID=191504 RepID=A0AAV5E207_ELECO|nr:hypothetical protein PR202_gb03510 [Eleusine coracana subsp. coracana]
MAADGRAHSLSPPKRRRSTDGAQLDASSAKRPKHAAAAIDVDADSSYRSRDYRNNGREWMTSRVVSDRHSDSYRCGELLNGRYAIQSGHGKGVFSTVVRAKDLQAGKDDPEQVSIKIIRINDTTNRVGKDKVSILRKLAVGCCLYELYTGETLFPGPSNNDMLRRHMELKGPFPKKMLRKGAFTAQHFKRDMNFEATEDDPVTRKVSRRLILNTKPKGIGSKVSNLHSEDPKLLSSFKDLLDKIFFLDPEKRITVEQALSHPFIITGKVK